jgi:hypothetical protein
MAQERKIAGFKKFSEIKKSKIEEVDPSRPVKPEDDGNLPMNPNLPETSKKVERPISRKGIVPKEQHMEVDSDKDEMENDIDLKDKKNESKVETFGKVAKFPKNTKASKAYNFLENVSVSKKSIWYILVEKQDNELQMVKYNVREGVDLAKFVGELKTFYTKKYANDKKVVEAVSKISVDGNDKFSMVKNISLLEVEGKKLITKITEDLIKLLSK